MTESTVPVSVVIPNHNAAKTIRECIQSILDNRYEDLEVVVVDDLSTDSSVEIAASFKDPRVLILRNETNLGPSGTRNRGIHAAKGRLVLFIDSDTHVNQDCIERHVRTHREMGADIVAGSIEGVHETIFGRADGFSNWWTSIPGSPSRFIERLHVPTTNLSIKKEVFEEIGLLKEDLRVGEDAEFSRRAIRRGRRIYFNAGIVAYHYDRDSLKSYLKHHYDWGLGLAERRSEEAEFSWLIPRSYFAALLSMVPLALLFTCFIVYRWLLVDPKVVLYFPILFLGKMAQTVAMKDSFR